MAIAGVVVTTRGVAMTAGGVGAPGVPGLPVATRRRREASQASNSSAVIVRPSWRMSKRSPVGRGLTGALTAAAGGACCGRSLALALAIGNPDSRRSIAVVVAVAAGGVIGVGTMPTAAGRPVATRTPGG